MSRSDPFEFDDEDDDRPRRRDRDDEGDDRPRRRRRGDDARNDYDDDMRGRRRAPSDGLGIASMIAGIISCVVALPGFCCILFSGVGLLGGIVAVILGFMGRSQNPASGQAKAGIITGFVAIGLSVAFVVLSLVLGFGRALMK
jgi:hypothetical protein